jgi:hypothetical protein
MSRNTGDWLNLPRKCPSRASRLRDSFGTCPAKCLQASKNIISLPACILHERLCGLLPASESARNYATLEPRAPLAENHNMSVTIP